MFLIEDPVTAVRWSYYFARLLAALVDLWVKLRCIRTTATPTSAPRSSKRSRTPTPSASTSARTSNRSRRSTRTTRSPSSSWPPGGKVQVLGSSGIDKCSTSRRQVVEGGHGRRAAKKGAQA